LGLQRLYQKLDLNFLEVLDFRVGFK